MKQNENKNHILLYKCFAESRRAMFYALNQLEFLNREIQNNFEIRVLITNKKFKTS